MCRHCDKGVRENVEHIREHSKVCENPDSCEITHLSGDVYPLIIEAWVVLQVTLDKMGKAKDLFLAPEAIPLQVIVDFEEHVQRCAELFARARVYRERAESAPAPRKPTN